MLQNDYIDQNKNPGTNHPMHVQYFYELQMTYTYSERVLFSFDPDFDFRQANDLAFEVFVRDLVSSPVPFKPVQQLAQTRTLQQNPVLEVLRHRGEWAALVC